jgi:ribokinase
MIVVFGSINVDVIMRVQSRPRIGETVAAEECLLRPGGKGANQAVAAARAGAKVAMFGAVGSDPFGREMRDGLTRNGVDAKAVAGVEPLTGCATITVDRAGENTICVAAGANGLARADTVPDEALTPDTIVLCQMEVPEEQNWALLRRAKKRGARTVLNLAPARIVSAAAIEALRDSVDFLIVNETEAELALAACRPGAPVDSAEENGRALARELGATVILTLGAEGARAIEKTRVQRAQPLSVEVVDTTGAGDTFTGVFAAALARGASIDVALREGAAAGSLACEGIGAQESMPTLERVQRALAPGKL